MNWQILSPREKMFAEVITILFFCMIYIFIIRVCIPPNFQQSGDIFIQVIISILVAYIIVDFTVYRDKEICFLEALSDLVDEMIENIERLTDEQYDFQINQIIEKKIRGDWIGFDKYPSFVNWNLESRNFYLKYLPSTNYYNFVNQGYFGSNLAKKIDNDTREIIAKTYFKFDAISFAIQDYENMNKIKNNLPETYKEYYYSIRNQIFLVYGTVDFMQESLVPILKLQELYPKIKKENKIKELKNKLKIN